MAYLQGFTRKCDTVVCLRAATVYLYSNRNEKLGQYCQRCGNKRLKERQRQEEESTRRRPA